VSNIHHHMARNFSCGGYAVLCGATISPTSTTSPDGQNTTFDGNTIGCVGYSQLSCGGPSGYSPGGDYSWTAATPMASPNCSGDLSCTDSSTGVGSGSISFEATNGSCFFSATSQVNVVVGPPDHLTVVTDNSGTPKSCQSTGIWVRQMLMQVVDVNGQAETGNPSVAESFNPAQPSNSCGNGSPIPSPCAAAGPSNCGSCSAGQFLDSMAVSGNLCNSGINPSSGCGFSETSTWSTCGASGNHTLWVSPRTTLSNSVTVDGHGKNTLWPAGTICNSTGCH
jgi:hypothetical protein